MEISLSLVGDAARHVVSSATTNLSMDGEFGGLRMYCEEVFCNAHGQAEEEEVGVV